LGFVLLGEKSNHSNYSDDDINVFKILSHQAALAIENCVFFEEFKHVQEKIFTAEKLASIGGMADGVAHQIRNRLNTFSIVAGDMEYEIEEFLKNNEKIINDNPGFEKNLNYLKKGASVIVDNVKKTASIINGILTYAKVEEKESFFSHFNLNEIIQPAVELLKVKHQVEEVPLNYDAGKEISIYGIKSQIMESIYNILDNCYEAVCEKRDYHLTAEEKEVFKPQLTLKATQKNSSLLIEISDNGIGIKEEDKHKIFAPFFTTKSSYKSGAGIGMYVVKRMIEENHKGKIWFESTYMQGSHFYIELPYKSQ
jgi:signal transduction histidine kinase